ncbi:MAG: FecR domain-containing protein [Deltaproteobacteria bacterium]
MSCREHEQLQALLRAGRELPYDEPHSEVVEQMRTSVIAGMPARSVPARSRRMWFAIGGIAAVAAVGLFVVAVKSSSSSSIERRRHATLEAIGPASFTRPSDGPDEVVRLSEGTLHVEVSPLSVGERCRIIAGDGEVEVRGTAFDVEVHGDHLVRVEVDHGRVEVRARGGTRILSSGGRWEVLGPAPAVLAMPPTRSTRSDDATVPSPSSGPAVALRPAHVTSNVIARDHSNPAPIVADAVREAEREFRAGWGALNAGDPRLAAEAFARAVAVDPRGAMAEDSAYWRAVALSRARDVAARDAFTSFLAQFPRATHAGDATIALGWILLRSGERDNAAARFHAAESDSSERIRANARAGLAELAHAGEDIVRLR